MQIVNNLNVLNYENKSDTTLIVEMYYFRYEFFICIQILGDLIYISYSRYTQQLSK